MDYATMLKTEAGETITPLFEKVRRLEKQRAAVLDRLKNERENLALAEATLADFKGQAAEKLTASTSAYAEWQGRLRRLKLEAETAREALALLDTETRPAVERDLASARKKLSEALTAAYRAARPAAEARMSELLDAVVKEHDAFFRACARLHLDHGFAFARPEFDPGVVAEHPRIARCGKRSLTAAMHFLAFSDPPAEAPAAAPVDVGAQDVAPTAQDAPQAPPTTAPDTGAGPEQAPNAFQNPDKAALDAPGATNGERLDTPDAPDAPDPEKKATTLLTGAIPEPAGTDPDADTAPPDLDAQDCAAVDAEYQADLDGSDAPPDAGEKNLGIAPDCA